MTTLKLAAAAAAGASRRAGRRRHRRGGADAERRGATEQRQAIGADGRRGRRGGRALAFGVGAWALSLAAQPALAETETAIVAGGCFWCVEADFDKVEGVLETVSGFIGGHVKRPTYKQVTGGGTGHYEAVRIRFDADVVSYRRLIDLFWRSVDPTDRGGQFCDRGDSYRTAVFALDRGQRKAAEASRGAAEKALGKKIVTPVLDAGPFHPAGDRHQDYYLGQRRTLTRFGIVKQSEAYQRYRRGCGRDARVRELWGEEAVFAR